MGVATAMSDQLADELASVGIFAADHAAINTPGPPAMQTRAAVKAALQVLLEDGYVMTGSPEWVRKRMEAVGVGLAVEPQRVITSEHGPPGARTDHHSLARELADEMRTHPAVESIHELDVLHACNALGIVLGRFT